MSQPSVITSTTATAAVNNNGTTSTSTTTATVDGSAPPKQTAATLTPNSIDPSRILNLNIGILGHVDSGKTSLVKTLSTLLSTAALDKSQQSRQRGITLDLGFSAFLIPLPPQIANTNQFSCEKYDVMQITLVDCPGHASLIRTIIGGAQIIDMVVLVVDATKGMQAQTTECLVIAEMTSRDLIVVLNKIDLLPEEERERRLKQVESQIRNVLRGTRFGDAKMVGVSACVGGEKVAAVGTTAGSTTPASGAATTGDSSSTTIAASAESSSAAGAPTTKNIDGLLHLLQSQIQPPRRQKSSDAFHFAIDHCFPIRGQGTVLTGTVLSGTASINTIIEFPTLAIQRKIKSLQMFKRKVQSICQGDRAGICVSNLDAKLMERGVAATPGCVRLIDGALALVRKVRYYNGKLVCGSKFHVSVGHSTVMATVTFWGARELAQRLAAEKGKDESSASGGDDEKDDGGGEKKQMGKDEGGSKSAAAVASAADSGKKKKQGEPKKQAKQQQQQQQQLLGSSSLGGDADIANLPKLTFNFDDDFIHQDEMLESIDETKGDGKGGTADDEGPSATATRKKKGKEDSPLHWALLDFQTPVYCPLDSLIIGSRLDVDSRGGGGATASDANVTATAASCRLAFSGRLVEKFDVKKDHDKIKMYTPKERRGTICRLGDPHRRTDDNKIVRYEVYGTDLFKKETNMKQFIGLYIETERNNEVGIIQSSFGTSGKFRVNFPGGTEARDGDALILRFKRYAHDVKKAIHQDEIVLKERSGTLIVSAKKEKKERNRERKVGAGGGGGRGGGGGGSTTNANGGAAATARASTGKGSVATQSKKVAPSAQSPAAAVAKSPPSPVATKKPPPPPPTPSNDTTTTSSSSISMTGEVSSLKGDILENGSHTVAIISGFFTPEVNIRELYANKKAKVLVPNTNEVGIITGPFGKAGKCKVTFENGISVPVGTKVELIPPP